MRMIPKIDKITQEIVKLKSSPNSKLYTLDLSTEKDPKEYVITSPESKRTRRIRSSSCSNKLISLTGCSMKSSEN